MTVLLVAAVPTDDFIFEELFTSCQNATLEFEPAIAVRKEEAPYIRASNVPPNHVREAVTAAPEVRDVEFVDTTHDTSLVRMVWADDGGNALITSFQRTLVTVLEAVGTDDGWYFTLRFASSDSVSRFHRLCKESGVSFSPVRLQQEGMDMAEETGRYGLTSVQRETLVRAFQAGYFKVPRQTSLVKLADSFAVSDNAVSERLRRGMDKLIETTLIGSRESDWIPKRYKIRLENN